MELARILAESPKGVDAAGVGEVTVEVPAV